MNDTLDELYKALKLDREKSHFTKHQNIKDRLQDLKGEVVELEESLDEGDIENFKKELGDVLWNTITIAIIAEEKGLFTLKESMHSALDKLKRRKSWLFEDRQATKEEEWAIWKEAKGKE